MVIISIIIKSFLFFILGTPFLFLKVGVDNTLTLDECVRAQVLYVPCGWSLRSHQQMARPPSSAKVGGTFVTQSTPFRLFVDNSSQETGQPAVPMDVGWRSSLSMCLVPETVCSG